MKNITGEIWKNVGLIDNHPNLWCVPDIWRTYDLERYEVSNLGRVRNLEHNKKIGNEPVIVKSQMTPDGYEFVKLYDALNFQKGFAVHRLVMFAFNPEGYIKNYHVHHKDGVRDNNELSNLEWIEPSDHLKEHGAQTAYTVYDPKGNKVLIPDIYEFVVADSKRFPNGGNRHVQGMLRMIRGAQAHYQGWTIDGTIIPPEKVAKSIKRSNKYTKNRALQYVVDESKLPKKTGGEMWKAIPDFPKYYVSNFARVYSFLANKVIADDNARYHWVGLTNNDVGVRRTFHLHDLVARAFVHNPDTVTNNVVDHKDGDSCVASNLRWLCRSTNVSIANLDTDIPEFVDHFGIVFEGCNTYEKLARLSKVGISNLKRIRYNPESESRNGVRLATDESIGTISKSYICMHHYESNKTVWGFSEDEIAGMTGLSNGSVNNIRTGKRDCVKGWKLVSDHRTMTGYQQAA